MKLFAYRPIVTPIQSEPLHKVVRKDGMQMGNFRSEETAVIICAVLEMQAKQGIGNAHEIRNDTCMPQCHGVVTLRAWVMDEYKGVIHYRTVDSKLFAERWTRVSRQLLVKAFARRFHPERRKALSFSLEYHPNYEASKLADTAAARLSRGTP